MRYLALMSMYAGRDQVVLLLAILAAGVVFMWLALETTPLPPIAIRRQKVMAWYWSALLIAYLIFFTFVAFFWRS